MVSLLSVTMQRVVFLPRVSHQSSRVAAEVQLELVPLVFLSNGAVTVRRSAETVVMSWTVPSVDRGHSDVSLANVSPLANCVMVSQTVTTSQTRQRVVQRDSFSAWSPENVFQRTNFVTENTIVETQVMNFFPNVLLVVEDLHVVQIRRLAELIVKPPPPQPPHT